MIRESLPDLSGDRPASLSVPIDGDPLRSERPSSTFLDIDGPGPTFPPESKVAKVIAPRVLYRRSTLNEWL